MFRDGHTIGNPNRLLEQWVHVAGRDEADGGLGAAHLIHPAAENGWFGDGFVLRGPRRLHSRGHHLVA